MASIMTGIELQDRFSSVLYGITDSINMVVGSLYDVSDAMCYDTAPLQAVQERIAETTAQITRMNEAFENTRQTQERFNDSVSQCQPRAARVETSFRNWEKAIIVANNALGFCRNLLGSAGVLDMSGAFERIDTMNRFQKTITTMTGNAELATAALGELKDITVGTAYGLDMASKAAQGFMTRGMSLGASVNQIRVWADAVSFYGEGTNEQLERVIDAVGKMYSKGKVEADQLDRLFDAGIGAAEIYADAVGMAVSDVKEDLSAGTISAAEFLNVVSQAMDAGVSNGAAKDAGATWATTFANVGAAINRGWVDVISGLDTAFAEQGLPSSMEMVQEFGQEVEATMQRVAAYAEPVAAVAADIAQAGQFIVENWSVIAPVLAGVAAAVVFLTGVQAAYNTVQAISNGLAAISAARSALMARQTLAQAAAATTATGAQAGLNAALLACPIVWVVGIIIALIAALYAVIPLINEAQNTSISATGLISGAVAVMAARIANHFIYMQNMVAAGANFFMNVWDHPIASVQMLFYDLCLNVMGYIREMAAGIETLLNSIPGVELNITGCIDSLYDNIAVARQRVKDESGWIEYAQRMDFIDYRSAAKAGYEFGSGIDERFSQFGQEFLNGMDRQNDYRAILDNSSLMNDVAGNTEKMADNMEISEEDLKYLRDIAEREVIDRTVFSTITVNMGGVNNNVQNMTDLDAIPQYLADKIQEQMDISAEGVHTDV